MQITLVFDDWRNRDQESVYQTVQGVELSMGDFHSGTTFEATVALDAQQAAELEDAMKKGFTPVFCIFPTTEVKNNESN